MIALAAALILLCGVAIGATSIGGVLVVPILICDLASARGPSARLD